MVFQWCKHYEPLNQVRYNFKKIFQLITQTLSGWYDRWTGSTAPIFLSPRTLGTYSVQKGFMERGNQNIGMLSCFSHVRLCATPQMAAHQAPPSMGFSRQEYWSGVPLLSPKYWYSSLLMYFGFDPHGTMDKNSSTRYSYQFSSFCTCLRLLSVGFEVIMLFFISCVYVQLFFPTVQILQNLREFQLQQHTRPQSVLLHDSQALCSAWTTAHTCSCLNINSFEGGAIWYLFWSSDFSQGLKNPSWRISLNSCPEIC